MNYKTYKLPELRQMVVRRYHSGFSEIYSSESANITLAKTFIQAPLMSGRPVEILLSDKHDLDELTNNTYI